MVRLVASADHLALLLLPVAIVVAPRPKHVRAPLVGGPAEVAEEPGSRPEPSNVRLAGQDEVHLEYAASEAELIPALDIAALEVLLLLLPLVLDRVVAIPLRGFEEALYREETVGRRGNHGAVVEVEGSPAARRVVVVGLVERRPRGVVAVREAATGDVELVGHDEFVGRSVDEGLRRSEPLGCVLVDPPTFNDRRCCREGCHCGNY
mmetsp:Transcript_22694/g.53594  ORF Transcript_22694/g.53594 Transcript_22694/m.53594 type:complete len:207 (-) Transcript_22694:173-793(-)